MRLYAKPSCCSCSSGLKAGVEFYVLKCRTSCPCITHLFCFETWNSLSLSRTQKSVSRETWNSHLYNCRACLHGPLVQIAGCNLYLSCILINCAHNSSPHSSMCSICWQNWSHQLLVPPKQYLATRKPQVPILTSQTKFPASGL